MTMQWFASVTLLLIHFTAIHCRTTPLEFRNFNQGNAPAGSRHPYVHSTVPSWFRPPKFNTADSEEHSIGSSARTAHLNRGTGAVQGDSRNYRNHGNSRSSAGSVVAPHEVYQNTSHRVVVYPKSFDPRPEEMRISNAMLFKQKDGQLHLVGAMNVTTPGPAYHRYRNWQGILQSTTPKPQIYGNAWEKRLPFTTQRSLIDPRYENRRDNLSTQNTRADRNYLQNQFTSKPENLPPRGSSNSWRVYTTPYTFRRTRFRQY